MIATLPAVQAGISHADRYICIGPVTIRYFKRHANRRHRRYLNACTRRIHHDVETWWDECFEAPSLSTWDVW